MSKQSMQIPHEMLRMSCAQLLAASGVPSDQARMIADVVVEADLRGIGSHGVLRLPAYIHRVKAGTMTAATELVALRSRGATLLLDAQHGFGQIAGIYAMGKAIASARENGVGFVGVRNAGHFGIAAYYAMMALPHGMIGLVCANAAPCMAAWGGVLPLLGTNPVCIALPTGGEVDIVLDMASSVVARGKIRLAKSKGEQIPAGWALDARGLPTQDPVEAMKGTLVPIGGPKGYGIALAVDVLSGVLTGSDFGRHIPATDETEKNVSAGFVMQVIDIAAIADVEEYDRGMRELVNDIRRSACAPGVERIYLPGEIEWLKKKEYLERGIPVPASLLTTLRDLGLEMGVALSLPEG